MRAADSLQGGVRETMLQAGGYWRPLAAVARLLEELGELVELLDAGASSQELAGELADLWIITAALADQFRIDLHDPAAAGPDRPGGRAWPAGGLVIAAGQIARIVNFYDGPKTPRRAGELPSLTTAMGAFHDQLELLSSTFDVALAGAVRDKLARIRAGADMQRFARDASDPSTAAVLDAVPGELARLRLWGAPADPTTPVAELARALAPSLSSFTRAAIAENLAAYLIGAPEPAGSEGLARWRAELVAELKLLDPRGKSEPTVSDARELNFNGMRLGAAIVALDGVPAAAGGARALLVLAPAEASLLADHR